MEYVKYTRYVKWYDVFYKSSYCDAITWERYTYHTEVSTFPETKLYRRFFSFIYTHQREIISVSTAGFENSLNSNICDRVTAYRSLTPTNSVDYPAEHASQFVVSITTNSINSKIGWVKS